MQNLDVALIDQPSCVFLYENHSLPVDGEIAVGAVFHTKEECMHAIKAFHIKHSLVSHTLQSDSTRYVIRCQQTTCPFTLRASKSKKNDLWRIATISNDHTCVSYALSQDHHNLDAKMICESIVPLLRENLSVTAPIIVAHIREKYNYTISYKKAWNARNKAIEQIYGNWVESYEALPQWVMVMEKWIPGTICRLETSPSHIDGQEFFERLFWAFKPCIEGFAHCKPLVQVDGTFLTGKFKGTLLLAVAQDGNNHIFPVAFALVEGETKKAWNFFLKNLREHVTPQEGICMISDRHAAIKSAYENPDNGWYHPPSSHVYCIRHIAQNFSRQFKDTKLRKRAVNMGKYLKLSILLYYFPLTY
jgi:hypothetical protein